MRTNPLVYRREIADLREAVRHYCLSLQLSDRFLDHSIIRLTTLWFKVMQTSNEDLLSLVPEINSIKAYQWYVVFQQLLTVACHPNDTLKVQVMRIISEVFKQYPKHVVWQILGMLNVRTGPKREFMMAVGRVEYLLNRLFLMSECIHEQGEMIWRIPIRSQRS